MNPMLADDINMCSAGYITTMPVVDKTTGLGIPVSTSVAIGNSKFITKGSLVSLYGASHVIHYDITALYGTYR